MPAPVPSDGVSAPVPSGGVEEDGEGKRRREKMRKEIKDIQIHYFIHM